MQRDDDGVTVRLVGPQGQARVLRASLLVAADGRLSAVRRMAGLVAELHDFGRSAIVCRMRHEQPHRQVAHEAFHHGHTLAVLPLDPDASAARLRAGLRVLLGVRVGVVVTDTAGRVWRDGLVDLAIGAAGVRVVEDERGRRDSAGRELAIFLPRGQAVRGGDVLVGEDGRDVFHVVHEVFKDELGFSEKAAVFGESFKRHADTPAQTALKDIEQLVTGTDSQAAAEAARKAKSLPFGGQLDPYKHIDDATLPTYLPRRGTAHDLVAPKVELPPLSHVDAAKQIKPRVESAGGEWTADHFRWLQQRYPAGVPQDQLDTIVAELSGPRAGHQKPLQLLRAAGGE